MKPIFKNTLAIIAGWLVGSITNMGLIQMGHQVFPIEGVDINNMDALAVVMPTLENKYFIFPLLAHALGTLVGAIVIGRLVVSHKMAFSMAIGGLFLIGGIMVNYMIPGPTWFVVADIVLAYIPMAWIGGTIAKKFT